MFSEPRDLVFACCLRLYLQLYLCRGECIVRLDVDVLYVDF